MSLIPHEMLKQVWHLVRDYGTGSAGISSSCTPYGGEEGKEFILGVGSENPLERGLSVYLPMGREISPPGL